mgnify:FL=1
MSKTEIKKIVRQYVKLLKDSELPVRTAYLFGSYAYGKPHRWSDIDVAIVINSKKNLWKNSAVYSRIGLAIDRRLETHLFNAQDFKDDSDPMVYEIRKKGLKIV